MQVKKSLSFCVLFIIIFASFNLFAQKEKPIRVEIEAKSNSDSYKIIPFGKKGVVLFYQSDEVIDKQNYRWYVTLFDTKFKEVWSSEFPVFKSMDLRFFDYNETKVYLYLEKKKENYLKADYQIITISINDGNVKSTNGIFPKSTYIDDFKVADNIAFVGGRTIPSRGSYLAQTLLSFTFIPLITGLNVNKYHSALYGIDLNKGGIKTIPTEYEGQSWVESILYSDTSKNFSVNIRNHIPKKTNNMFVNDYNESGLLLSSTNLQSNHPTRKLNTGKMFPLGNNSKIVIGTYNNAVKGRKANPAFFGFNEESTGIYFAKIENNQQKFVNFYNFADFKTFFSYINDKRAARLKLKALKKQSKGKELSFNYKLLLHDIIQTKNQTIVIAEAYYPEYHTVSYTSYDAYGRPYTNTYQVFDGYRYTNALVASFNEEGKLLWDNSFEIWNILTYNLKERVKVLFDNDDIILAYSSEGNIASKIIRNNQVIEGKTYTKIQTNYNNDKLITDFNSDMEFWYGNYFISYGYQKIKNTSATEKSKRTVFYFNKIAFE
ncbi:MAG: hypothetical protein HXX09_13840 [Bacteroidetes bacterium]|nr:hypothetical protein [Bacteroidota bacterium]